MTNFDRSVILREIERKCEKQNENVFTDPDE